MAFDVALSDSGDLPVRTTHISGPDFIAQRIKTRLQLFKGEYLLDQRRGLPYLQWKQDRPVDVDAIGARIRSEIARTPGVTGVSDFEASFDSGHFTVSATISIDDVQARLEAEVFSPDGNSHPAITLIF